MQEVIRNADRSTSIKMFSYERNRFQSEVLRAVKDRESVCLVSQYDNVNALKSAFIHSTESE